MTGVSCRRTAAITPCPAKLIRLSSMRFRAPATPHMRRTNWTARPERDVVEFGKPGFRAIAGEQLYSCATVLDGQIVLSSYGCPAARTIRRPIAVPAERARNIGLSYPNFI